MTAGRKAGTLHTSFDAIARPPSGAFSVHEHFRLEARLAHRLDDLLDAHSLRQEVYQDVLLALPFAYPDHPTQTPQRLAHPNGAGSAARALHHQLSRDGTSGDVGGLAAALAGYVARATRGQAQGEQAQTHGEHRASEPDESVPTRARDQRPDEPEAGMARD